MGFVKSPIVVDVGSEREMELQSILSPVSLSYSLALWVYNHLGSLLLKVSF